jgi:hypothetical protein
LKVAILCDVKVLRLIQGKSKKVKPPEKLSFPTGDREVFNIRRRSIE